MVSKRVLVVDDSPTNRQALSNLLQREGYEVTTAVDGEDALAKIAADPPPLGGKKGSCVKNAIRMDWVQRRRNDVSQFHA